MNILFLRGFNNYFNRTIKKYSTLADYKSNSQSFLDLASINFNPNDGVVTELVIGNTDQKENNAPLAWDTIGTPDYAICYEMEGSPAAAVIKFRWFVLESERTRNGQYRIALKRDVFAEHFDIIKAAPCFIEKGMIDDIDNPLIFNKEGMTYNQIKEKEYLLKDSTESGWVVGYVPKNLPSSTDVSNLPTISTTILMEGDPTDYYTTSELPFSVSTTGTTTCYHYSPNKYRLMLTYAGIGYQNISNTYAYRYRGLMYLDVTANSISKGNKGLSYNTSDQYNSSTNPVSVLTSTSYDNNTTYTFDEYTISPTTNSDRTYLFNTVTGTSSGGILNGTNSTYFQNAYINVPASFYSNSNVSSLRSYINTAMNSISGVVEEVAAPTSYNGKIVKVGNDFYQMNISASGAKRYDVFRPTSGSSTTLTSSGNVIQYHDTLSSTDVADIVNDINLVSYKYNSGSSGSYVNYLTNHGDAYLCIASSDEYSITLSPIRTETLSLSNRVYTSRAHTYDSTADIFAIPYGNINLKVGNDYYMTNKTRGLAMGRAIASAFSDSCYDLQLVPYCPSEFVRNYIAEEGYLDSAAIESAAFQTYTTSSGGGDSTIAGFVLWCSSSKGTFDINMRINPNISYQGVLSQALEYKISNETELCRLASPNFNGQFEFSIAKNHGVLKFNVDYTYKPYSPYIHVNPDFKGIYGKDWDDSRGLVCGGDFSVAHITSYWQTYMNNNKNFQQIFDRQIQNMDVNNAIAMEKQEFQATVGTITSAIGGVLGGGAAGASAGSFAGPWGAAIGGVVGAIGGGIGAGMASAYGASKDIDWLQRQQQESRSYAVDMYSYQLGNIQAMPYSLKGTDALTNNNKIWPIVEIYEPTEMEVEILKDKIQYNGMTIMAVDNIRYYLNSEDFEYVFIKGQIIRLESEQIKDDFHIADAIYQEINKGVYIPSGGL